MKRLNALEDTLAGWIPRQPSENVARRLFGAAEGVSAENVTGAVWQWLTSAAGGGLAVLLLMGGFPSVREPGGNTGSLLRLGGNPPGAVTPGLNSLSHANCWGGQSFEWTRTGSTPSSIGSVMLLATNRSGH
jgi:hypothetical protein